MLSCRPPKQNMCGFALATVEPYRRKKNVCIWLRALPDVYSHMHACCLQRHVKAVGPQNVDIGGWAA